MRLSHTCRLTLLLQTLKFLRLQSFENMQFMELVLYALEMISSEWAHPIQFVLDLGFCICNENIYESGTQISYIVWFILHICNVDKWIELSTEDYLAVTFARTIITEYFLGPLLKSIWKFNGSGLGDHSICIVFAEYTWGAQDAETWRSSASLANLLVHQISELPIQCTWSLKTKR